MYPCLGQDLVCLFLITVENKFSSLYVCSGCLDKGIIYPENFDLDNQFLSTPEL